MHSHNDSSGCVLIMFLSAALVSVKAFATVVLQELNPNEFLIVNLCLQMRPQVPHFLQRLISYGRSVYSLTSIFSTFIPSVFDGAVL